ncbi:MAG: extracellular solute-binding protein [Zoogloeaceae bacterium]|jgi:sn-glycerol 3-phosphate transport system substrate-binding protein|nr:extracellular solute-binding protein [Zoogloeaceae bacterium]
MKKNALAGWIAAFLFSVAPIFPAASAPTEIAFSHQLAEADAERLAALVERFNRQQTDVRVKLARAGVHGKPAVLSLSTPDTIANFLLRKTAFKPVHQLLRETGASVPLAGLSADLLASGGRNRLMALPVAFATPVLYYNKRIFRLAGLDPDRPPRTWREMADTAGRLITKGSHCPYASSWPVWVHIDNVSAVSGVSVADRKGRLEFNGLMQVKHIAMLASWHKSGYFHTFGRANEADAEFFRGNCVMLTSSSRAHSHLRDAPGVELGVAALPYHDDARGAPGHTLADGASIWIGSGYKAADYRAAARFVRFVLAPETQAEIARVGGFLPLTDAIRQSLRARLAQDEEYALDVAYASLQGKGATHPLRVSTLEPVRMIADEELEQVWAGKKPAKAALDVAVKRGNAVLSAKPALKKVVSF